MTEQLIYRVFDAGEVRVDYQTRTIAGAIASDESVDSHESIIRTAGWDLGRYHKNPVLLWQHDASKPENVLGRATINIADKRMVADLHFSRKGLNPQADLVFNQMVDKDIRGLSVGFKPIEVRNIKLDGRILAEYTRQELVELSVVIIPSNQNALRNRAESTVMNQKEASAYVVRRVAQLTLRGVTREEAHNRAYLELKRGDFRDDGADEVIDLSQRNCMWELAKRIQRREGCAIEIAMNKACIKLNNIKAAIAGAK